MNFIPSYKTSKSNRIIYLFIYSLLVIGLNSNFLLSQTPNDNIDYFQVGFSANVFRGVYMKDATAAAKVLTEFFLKKYHRENWEVKPPEVISNNDELRKIIQEQEFEVLVMHPSEFIQVKDLGLLEPIAVSWRNGSPYDSYQLLVNKNNKYKSLEDLKNKSVLICSLEGSKAELWLGHI